MAKKQIGGDKAVENRLKDAGLPFGSNYTLDEDSNGDLVVKDADGNVVLKHDHDADEWKSIAALQTDDATLTGADGHTIGGDPLAGFPDTTTDPGLTLGGSFTVLDANRPTLLQARASATTDGSTDGLVLIDIDNSGGTAVDHRAMTVWADKIGGDGFENQAAGISYIPAGASVKVNNFNDPKSSNSLDDQNLYTL